MREARRLDGARRHRRGEDAEVGDFDVAVGGDDHVRRRETEVREPAAVRVTDGARCLRDECECAARRRSRRRRASLSCIRRNASRPATYSTAVNVWPCATPNSLMRAMRGCSRLPYERAAADSACASAPTVSSGGIASPRTDVRSRRRQTPWRARPCHWDRHRSAPAAGSARRAPSRSSPSPGRRLYPKARDDATRCQYPNLPSTANARTTGFMRRGLQTSKLSRANAAPYTLRKVDASAKNIDVAKTDKPDKGEKVAAKVDAKALARARCERRQDRREVRRREERAVPVERVEPHDGEPRPEANRHAHELPTERRRRSPCVRVSSPSRCPPSRRRRAARDAAPAPPPRAVRSVRSRTRRTCPVRETFRAATPTIRRRRPVASRPATRARFVAATNSRLIYRVGTCVITEPVASGRAASGGWSNTLPPRSRATPTRRSAADSSRTGSRTIVLSRVADEKSKSRKDLALRSSWLVRWALEAPERWLGRRSTIGQDVAGGADGLSYLRHLVRGNRSAPARCVRRRHPGVAAGAHHPRLPRDARLDVHARAPARRGRLRVRVVQPRHAERPRHPSVGVPHSPKDRAHPRADPVAEDRHHRSLDGRPDRPLLRQEARRPRARPQAHHDGHPRPRDLGGAGRRHDARPVVDLVAGSSCRAAGSSTSSRRARSRPASRSRPSRRPATGSSPCPPRGFRGRTR